MVSGPVGHTPCGLDDDVDEDGVDQLDFSITDIFEINIIK